jgi:CheY-like chemotaxis protein
MMPVMDGWATLKTLKADPELADIPVIIQTMINDRNMGFALGAYEYLTKPIEVERLIAVLQQIKAAEVKYDSAEAQQLNAESNDNCLAAVS